MDGSYLNEKEKSVLFAELSASGINNLSLIARKDLPISFHLDVFWDSVPEVTFADVISLFVRLDAFVKNSSSVGLVPVLVFPLGFSDTISMHCPDIRNDALVTSEEPPNFYLESSIQDITSLGLFEEHFLPIRMGFPFNVSWLYRSFRPIGNQGPDTEFVNALYVFALPDP